MPLLNKKPLTLLKGSLPLIGHGHKLKDDPDAFFQQCRAQHGNIFMLKIQGAHSTYFNSAKDINNLFAQSKKTSPDEINAKIVRQLFMQSDHHYDEQFKGQVKVIRECLKKQNLTPYIQNMQHTLIDAVDTLSTADEVNLHDFIGRLIFVAASDALFASQLFLPKSYDDFNCFDRHSFYLSAGVPAFLLRGCIAARNRLFDKLKTFQSGVKDRPLVSLRHKVFKRFNLSAHDIAAADFSLFWAGNTNTINIAFWVVYHAALDAKLKQKLINEIENTAKNCEKTAHGLPLLTEEATQKMSIMDSTIHECLRLYSGSMALRDATEDFSMTLSDGSSLDIKKGERLSVYPRSSHLDPNNFKHPEQFQHDRFLNDPSLRAYLFPFGGGGNICPGRFFAISEFKLALTVFLSLLDFELINPDVEVIPDKKRLMLGSAPPLQDVQFKVKKKHRYAVEAVA